MKKQLSYLLKRAGTITVCLGLLVQANAQKQQALSREKNTSPVTQEMINKVNEIVKPVKEQLDKRLSGDKAYQGYLKEVERINGMKSNKERDAYAGKINEKYNSVFQKAWAEANVDEKSYQQKIRMVFPDQVSKGLQFTAYLGFFIVVTYTVPPASEPPAKCLEVCGIAMGSVEGTSAIISNGGGSYGNCFLKADSWGAVAGGNNVAVTLKNGITIPGTLPDDSRRLHVWKRYDVDQSATSFAGIGFGMAETYVRTNTGAEYLLAMSPVIGTTSKVNKKTIVEDYYLEKKDVAKSMFRAYANTMTYGISGNWCHTDCYISRWTICEEK
jgi:hypothetical protein